MGLEQRQESEGWLVPRLYEFPRHCSLPQTFRYHPTEPVFCSLYPSSALTIPGLGKCVGNINFPHECIYSWRERGRVRGMGIRNIGTNIFRLPLFLSLSTNFFFLLSVSMERGEKRFVALFRNKKCDHISIHTKFELKSRSDYEINFPFFPNNCAHFCHASTFVSVAPVTRAFHVKREWNESRSSRSYFNSRIIGTWIKEGDSDGEHARRIAINKRRPKKIPSVEDRFTAPPKNATRQSAIKPPRGPLADYTEASYWLYWKLGWADSLFGGIGPLFFVLPARRKPFMRRLNDAPAWKLDATFSPRNCTWLKIIGALSPDYRSTRSTTTSR